MSNYFGCQHCPRRMSKLYYCLCQWELCQRCYERHVCLGRWPDTGGYEPTTSHNRGWQQLWDNLSNPENRRELATEIDTTIACQIKALREKNEWVQGELAKRTNKEQPTIAQLEDPNYGRYSLVTLKKLANAFDVALIVRFVPFSELVDWLADLTPDKLAPLSYKEEQERCQALTTRLRSDIVQP